MAHIAVQEILRAGRILTERFPSNISRRAAVGVESHQERVKRIVLDSFGKDEGVVMAVYPQETHNALVPGFLKDLDRSVFAEDLIGLLPGPQPE